MELKLNEKEVERILMDWAETHFPGKFNRVDIDEQYGHFRHVEFRFDEPEPPTPIKEAA